MIFLSSIKTGLQFVLKAFIQNPKLIFVKKNVGPPYGLNGFKIVTQFINSFSSNEQVAKKSLSRLEATLELIHKWMRQKIHLFTQTWKIRPLMQVGV